MNFILLFTVIFPINSGLYCFMPIKNDHMILQKAIDLHQNIYFALHIKKGSVEMEIIKSCPVRFWHKHLKVWLVLYSTAHWQILKEKFKEIPYEVAHNILTFEYPVPEKKQQNPQRTEYSAQGAQ